jgi:hypothetical protein
VSRSSSFEQLLDNTHVLPKKLSGVTHGATPIKQVF